MDAAPEAASAGAVVPDKPSAWREILATGSPEALPTSEEGWKKVLEPMQYAVLREQATEPKWSSELNDIKEGGGVFLCAGCGAPLFTLEAKYESGSGWPSFYAPVDAESVEAKTDFKAIVPRTETLCGTCGGHLGHCFDDGPPPTGLRYCMNGAALSFERDTPRAERAAASFAAVRDSGSLRPPLLKNTLDALLSASLSLGLLWSAWVNLQADGGELWAQQALRNSDMWLFGAVNAIFGRPPGGPLALLLAGLNGLTVAQKFRLIQEALKPKDT